ncbi:MAG: NAD(P)H-quinone dehydrogenase, partial [Sphingomonas bacterium]|nr:NAD(P)H-quinone dehydrogenase [Sphingomonas bacterium]
MMGIKDGFEKHFARTGSGTVNGGVIVPPHASDLNASLTIELEHRLT